MFDNMTTSGSQAMSFSSEAESFASSSGEMCGEDICEMPLSQDQEVSGLRRSSSGEAEEYKELGQIGHGGFGNCFLLERTTDKALRVCKVQVREDFDNDEVPIEVNILRDMLPRHDRILRLHDCILQPTTVQLYYEYYSEGDLGQLIRRYNDQWQDFPESFLWHVYLQLTDALSFLHFGYTQTQPSQLSSEWTSIIHGDIKDKNVFLGPPDPSSTNPLARQYPSLVLGDFGMADTKPSNRWGTPKWQPPELPITSMKADVWGVGAIIHALAHEGKPPLAPLPPWAERIHMCAWYEEPCARDPLPISGVYSDELDDCVSGALEFDPNKRLDSHTLHLKISKAWDGSET